MYLYGSYGIKLLDIESNNNGGNVVGLIVESVLINIVSGIILETTNKYLSNKLAKKSEVQNSIKELIYNDLSSIDLSEIDSSIMHSFLNSIQVSDYLEQYIDFVILKTSIKNRAPTALNQIDRTSLINYFVQNVTSRYKDAGKTINSLILEQFFTKLLDSISNIFFNHMKIDDKGIVFLINSHMDKLEVINDSKLYNIEKKVENIINILIRNQQFSVVNPDKQFETIRMKYVNILVRNNQYAFIYTMSDLKLSDFYVPPKFECNFSQQPSNLERMSFSEDELNPSINAINFELNFENSISIEWKDIFSISNIMYITGGAGYGKSLFLKHLINNYHELRNFHSDVCLPIYCDLKEYDTQCANSPISIIEFLQNSIIESTGIDEVSTEFVKYYLNSGRCLILLDALDEVKKEHRQDLHTKFIGFFLESNANNKICMTSRDRGFIPQNDIVAYSICDLSTDDIEKYIDNLIVLNRFESDDKLIFMNQVSKLIRKNFMNNFLSISLMVSIFKSEKSIPENKVNLYSKCFEYISKTREIDKDKGTKKFDFIQMKSLLDETSFIALSILSYPNNQNIAESLIHAKFLSIYSGRYDSLNTADNAIDLFLAFCSERTEIFVCTNEEGKYKFYHRSFFEYFYSKHIDYIADIEELVNELFAFDIDSEIFELVISYLKANNYNKYKSVIDLIFKRVDIQDFTTKCNNLKVLSLCMLPVDDYEYIKKFIETIEDMYSYFALDSATQNFSWDTLYFIVSKNNNKFSDLRKRFIDDFKFPILCDIIRMFTNLKENFKIEESLKIDFVTIFFSKHNCYFTYFAYFDYGIDFFFEYAKSLSNKQFIYLFSKLVGKKPSRRLLLDYSHFKKLSNEQVSDIFKF